MASMKPKTSITNLGSACAELDDERSSICASYSLKLPQSLIPKLWDVTRMAYPREACGLLFGTSSSFHTTIEEFWPVPNRAMGLNGFAISTQDIVQTCKETDTQLIGLFHSHRHTPTPSSSDSHAMQQSPLIWLIAASGMPPSGQAFQLKAFAWQNEDMLEFTIKEIADDHTADVCTATSHD